MSTNIRMYKVIFEEGRKNGVCVLPAESEQDAIEKVRMEFPSSRVTSVKVEPKLGRN